MIFTKQIRPQAVAIPYNWCAEYYGGDYISEYNLNTHEHNDFYTIDQSNIERFGLFGQNMIFYYEADGTFKLNGKAVQIKYETKEGKVYHLTPRFEQKDVITYKQAYANYSGTEGVQQSHIESIDFGYKTILNFEDGTLMKFQPIVRLPFSEKAVMEVSITSNTNLEGELVFYTNKVEVDRFNATMFKNIKGQINWIIK